MPDDERPLTPVEAAIKADLVAAVRVTQQQIDRVGPGRYHSLASTALEQALMWALKELGS